jgi:hypothetical protein
MSEEKQFTDGLIFKLPRDNAPDFVKGSLSVKVEEFKAWLDAHVDNGWVNIDLKVSQGGKAYAEKNTWKPDGGAAPQKAPEDIPF